MFSKLIPALGGIALCAAATGCVVVDHGGQPPPEGTLTTSWTLNGSSSPDACTYYQVDRVRVIVADDTGLALTNDEPFCEDFDMSVDLSIGSYSTEATLLDVGGRALSDTTVTHVRVLADTVTFVDVDFPEIGRASCRERV